MLESVIFNLFVSKFELDATLEVVKSLSLVKINCQSKQEAPVAAQNGGEDAHVDESVVVLDATVGVQEIWGLDKELRKVFHSELGTGLEEFCLVYLITDVIYA